MSAAETGEFGPYAFSLTADEARIAAARAGLRRALAGGLTAAHFAPLAAFVLAILFVAILALTGLLGRRVGRGGAAGLRRRLSRPTAGDATTLLRQPPPRRGGDRAAARRRAACRSASKTTGSNSMAVLRGFAGASPIASKPKTPGAFSICGRAPARRRSRLPVFLAMRTKRHSSRSSCARSCRDALIRQNGKLAANLSLDVALVDGLYAVRLAGRAPRRRSSRRRLRRPSVSPPSRRRRMVPL